VPQRAVAGLLGVALGVDVAGPVEKFRRAAHLGAGRVALEERVGLVDERDRRRDDRLGLGDFLSRLLRGSAGDAEASTDTEGASVQD
jgi:hypothetical protein